MTIANCNEIHNRVSEFLKYPRIYFLFFDVCVRIERTNYIEVQLEKYEQKKTKSGIQRNLIVPKIKKNRYRGCISPIFNFFHPFLFVLHSEDIHIAKLLIISYLLLLLFPPKEIN